MDWFWGFVDRPSSLFRSSGRVSGSGDRLALEEVAMNDGDVSRQIAQMVKFIRQEAEEKANEISVSADEVRASANPGIDFPRCSSFIWLRVAQKQHPFPLL